MNKKTDRSDTSGGSTEATPRKFEIAGAQDLPDSPHDQEEMKSESTIIDLPDVKDIPGQEHVTPTSMGELADNTAASDDEEGVGVFEEEDEEDEKSELMMGTDSDVSTEEKND